MRTLRTNNVHYTRNSVLNITNISGTTLFDIFQSKEMGVNIITGIGETISGTTRIVYRDTTPKIGAKITFNNFSAEWGPFDFWDGFHLESLGYRGYIFTSFDFPAKNNYYFSLFGGVYSIDLYSIPH